MNNASTLRTLAAAATACLSAGMLGAQSARELVAQELRDDPYALLGAIGSADRTAAEQHAAALSQRLAGQPALRLRLLRLGFLDGRYATHQDFDGRELTLGGSTALLPFWIDEYGTNCCRRCVAHEALGSLFRGDGSYFHEEGEHTGARLRRRLLPRQEQLRWSRLAGGYVVAGR
jgi:hypothetical protein